MGCLSNAQYRARHGIILLFAKSLTTKSGRVRNSGIIFIGYLMLLRLRLGEHKKALTAFLGLSSRGLPVFSVGLSYAVNRLRVYNSVSEEYFQGEQIQSAKGLLEKLQPFATHADFSKMILTFPGIDP
jgi:hypothetical protein